MPGRWRRRKRVSVVQDDVVPAKKEKYVQIHNSQTTTYVLAMLANVAATTNVTGGTEITCKNIVSVDCKFKQNCIDETPNNVQGSYKMKTTSCDPKVNDACTCFEVSRPYLIMQNR